MNNILFLTTYPHGGAGVACRRLRQALERQGIQSQLLTQQDTQRWPFYAERLSFLPWEASKSVRFSYSLANFGTDISRHPAVQSADLIHLHWWNQGFLSLKNLHQLAQTGKPVVWTLHDMWAFTGGCHHVRGCDHFEGQCGHCHYLRWPSETDLSNQIWKKKQQFYPKNMRIVTCSQWLANEAKRSSLLKNHTITTIPNPLDTTLFKPVSGADRQSFRQKIGAAPESRLLLFVAMNISNPFKGFPYFKTALQSLKNLRPDLPVEIVALGKSQPGELDGLPYPVRSLGLVSQPEVLAAAYGAADLFVTPSLEENLPNTIMEAMSCGTPAVGFEVGGIPEMIDHRVNGCVTPFKNSDQLAHDIAWVLDSPERHEALRQAARDKVLRCYDQDVVASAYRKVYEMPYTTQ